MEEYFHFHKNIIGNWKIGDEIILGEDENPYWHSLADVGDFIEINGGKFDVDLIVRHAFEAYIRKNPAPIIMKGYHFQPLKTLNETINSLGNALKICRELAFELIRRDFYPQLPSRQKCIWLIPNNE